VDFVVLGNYNANSNTIKDTSELRARLEAKGDGKCYCPCDCRGFNERRLLIKTIET